MKRSVGVTIIAVLSLLGSVFTLLMGILVALVPFLISLAGPRHDPPTPAPFPPGAIKGLMVAVSLVYVLPAIWGIITSIGLFRLKEWARTSIIVFAVLLVIMSGFGGLVALLVPMTPVPNQAADPGVMTGVRIFMGTFSLFMTSIGVWWLVFFTRAKVKQQFVSLLPSVSALTHEARAFGPVPTLVAVSQKVERPLSLTILAWFLLISVAFIPINLWLHAPAVVFTRIITGWPATLYFLSVASVQLYIGIGLLRLRLVARTVGIAYFGFMLMNMVVFYLAPGGLSRTSDLLTRSQSMYPGMQTWQNQQVFAFDVKPFFIIGILAGLLGLLVPLYYLVTRRQAFERAAAAAKRA